MAKFKWLVETSGVKNDPSPANRFLKRQLQHSRSWQGSNSFGDILEEEESNDDDDGSSVCPESICSEPVTSRHPPLQHSFSFPLPLQDTVQQFWLWQSSLHNIWGFRNYLPINNDVLDTRDSKYCEFWWTLMSKLLNTTSGWPSADEEAAASEDDSLPALPPGQRWCARYTELQAWSREEYQVTSNAIYDLHATISMFVVSSYYSDIS